MTDPNLESAWLAHWHNHKPAPREAQRATEQTLASRERQAFEAGWRACQAWREENEFQPESLA